MSRPGHRRHEPAPTPTYTHMPTHTEEPKP
ncbi:hypothetical protein QFZ66_007089 [Streptomyces sp. B4I13]|uniref:Uncharacterized protein n=1 Tax=Streptomyces achromogenes TaxID=67255 RepID=A0ABU0PVS0_STRAH|nr:hypothetical protein [Streptomyces achromogenes]MDQ0829694.1 hypothetical protein [Streptomyces achromogenes]MDQ0963211.1 hypothetical protein [Streptomyces sp. B4I13]